MRKIVYVDMDNVLVDFKTGISRLTPEELKLFEDRYDEVPNIFSKMDPIENAIVSYEKLCCSMTPIYFPLRHGKMQLPCTTN